MGHDPKSPKIMFLAKSVAGGNFVKIFYEIFIVQTETKKFQIFSNKSSHDHQNHLKIAPIDRSRSGMYKNGLRIDLNVF